MDGRGRLAEPVMESAQARPAAGLAPAPRQRARSRRRVKRGIRLPSVLRRWSEPLLQWRLPRGLGIAAVLLLVSGSIGFGAIRGGHLPAVIDDLRDVRDAIANTLGF